MIDTVWTKCQDYYDQIPRDTLPAVGLSLLASFAVNVIYLNRNLLMTKNAAEFEGVQPAVAALVAGTASLIHALTAPIFDYIFGDNEVKFEREIIKAVCVLSLTYLFLNRIPGIKAHQLAILVFQRTFPSMLFKAEIDLFARFVDAVGARAFGNACRQAATYVGLNVGRNANSTYYCLPIMA